MIHTLLNSRQLGAGLLVLYLTACSDFSDPMSAFEQGNYEEALQGWRMQAQSGDSVAQNYLGIHYQLGLGTKRDYISAVKWYRDAAIAGNANAQRNLGAMYDAGLGVEQDYVWAYAWYYAAQVHGNENAQGNIDSLAGKLTPNQIMKSKSYVRDYLKENLR